MKCIAHNVEYCQTCNDPQAPFRATFEGWTSEPDSLDEWPNTVTVEAVTGYDAAAAEASAEDRLDLDEHADAAGDRELVEIDTNYKATRPGQHPVRLTRTDAARLAGAILEATENTFHYTRCGRLRPADAKDLLAAIRDVEFQLGELRDHALTDLLIGAGLETDWMRDVVDNMRTGQTEQDDPAAEEGTQAPAEAEPREDDGNGADEGVAESGPADELIPKIPVEDSSFAGALVALFPTAAEEIKDSDAFGALSFKVDRRCQETGETPRQVFESLDADTRAFVPRANDPAAFLASRIDS